MILNFTDHAIEQFVNRFAKHMSLREARNLLEHIASSATKSRDKTLRGDIVWLGNWGGREIRFVTKKDHIDWAVVTVLPEQVDEGEVDEDVLLAIANSLPSLLEVPPRGDDQPIDMAEVEAERERETTRQRKQQQHRARMLAQRRASGPDWMRELLADAYVALGHRPAGIKRNLREVLTDSDVSTALQRAKLR